MERRAWRQGGQIGTEQLGKLAGKGGNQRASVDMIMGASRDGHGRARTRQRTRTGTGVPGLGRSKQAGRQAGMQGRQGRQAGMQGFWWWQAGAERRLAYGHRASVICVLKLISGYRDSAIRPSAPCGAAASARIAGERQVTLPASPSQSVQ